jgi:hypothetical protein
MRITRIENVFSESELLDINETIDSLATFEDNQLGRVQNVFEIPSRAINVKLHNLANGLSNKNLTMASAAYAHYSKEHGQPNLPPHFDSDSTDLVIDYQLEANISWDLGINQELYPLQDNSAIVFNPNTNIHWRPHIRFEEGEYVKMLFFRFVGREDVSDYSDKDYKQGDKIFKQVREYRDSLKDRTVF